MTVDFQDEPDADFSNLLGTIHADIARLVLKVGGITRGGGLCYSATFGSGSGRSGGLTGVGDGDHLPGAFFDKLDGEAQGLAATIGSIHQVQRIHQGHHGYEIRGAQGLWKGHEKSPSRGGAFH